MEKAPAFSAWYADSSASAGERRKVPIPSIGIFKFSRSSYLLIFFFVN